MADLKGVWEQTAKSFVLAFNDLGISVAASVKAGVAKAVDWARKDNPHYEAAQGTEIPTPEEESPAAAEETVQEQAEETSEE